MRAIISVLVLVLCLGAATSGFAADKGDSMTPQIVKKGDSKWRKQYADRLENFITKINDSIPSLSPSEKELLDREYTQATESENWTRYFNITSKDEYKTNYVKEKSDYIVSILYGIKKTDDIQYEMYSWSFIVTQLTSNEYWSKVYNLMLDDKIDKEIFRDAKSKKNPDHYEDFYLKNGVLAAQQIMNYIFIPYFEDGFKKQAPTYP
jgi:hypothetical protein